MPEGQTIDVVKIVSERTGKRIPRFLGRMMERFIHQDYINGFSSNVTEIFRCLKFEQQIDEMEKTKINVTQYRQTKDEQEGWIALALIAVGVELLLSLLYYRTMP